MQRALRGRCDARGAESSWRTWRERFDAYAVNLRDEHGEGILTRTGPDLCGEHGKGGVTRTGFNLRGEHGEGAVTRTGLNLRYEYGESAWSIV